MESSPGMELMVAGQTLAIYLLLIVGLRSIGHRTMGQLTIVEYLIIALLGSAVETGLYAGSSSLRAGIVSAATLLVANRALSFAAGKFMPLRRLLVKRPVLLVDNGRIVWRHLREENMTEEDLLAAIRRRGYASTDDVRFAVLEIDGSVGVVARKAQ